MSLPGPVDKMSLQVQHIAEWVCTFDGVEGVDSATGVVDVLPTVWHSITGLVVEEVRGTSWVTRKQNLGRLLLSIASWYDKELDKTFDLNFIRLDALSRDGDVPELLWMPRVGWFTKVVLPRMLP